MTATIDDSGIRASTTIEAPPGTVFAILADPRQHARIDGSGTVQDSVSGPDQLSLGSTFGMKMKLGAPYRIKNKVVEFEQDRLIAWKHVGAHRWRYELEPVEGGTRVTETWDISRYPGFAKKALKVGGFHERTEQGIPATLKKLKAVAEADAG